MITIISSFQYEANAQQPFGSWSGSMSMHQTTTTLITKGEKHITVTFTDNKGTASIIETGELILGGKLICKSTCAGTGPATLLDVLILQSEGTYSIS